MKVGFLGPEATFTHIAVQSFFPKEEHIPFSTIPSCIDGIMEGDLDFAVVPLENTIEGSVNITLDYIIHEVDCKIVGEMILPIHQHLLMHKNQSHLDLKDVVAVFSHPQAIAQSHRFLHKDMNGVETVEKDSTSNAAKWVSEHEHIPYAAIANELAAKTYDLDIVKRDIHSFENNQTRFVILAKNFRDIQVDQEDAPVFKTTLVITPQIDQAGNLHQILSAFAWRKLNLSKIESRPMKTGLGNYFFIVDINHNKNEKLISFAIEEIETLGCSVKILGEYSSVVLKPSF